MGCNSSKPVRTNLKVKALQRGIIESLVLLHDKNIKDRYDVIRTVGKGSIGEVTVVRLKRNMNETLHGFFSETFINKERLYAMKTVYTSKMSKLRFQEFENEVNILQQLCHPNIIQLREVFYHRKQIYMIMDLCSGGHLNERTYIEDEICEIVVQILRALTYMHESVGICHRDLKMENVMLENKGEPITVKLIDFGMSQKFSAGDESEKIGGTVYSMAPEVLLGSNTTQRRLNSTLDHFIILQPYTQHADMWSVGVIAYYLCCGEVPFLRKESDINNEDLVDRFVTGRFEFSSPLWLAITDDAKTLIVNLLRVMPRFRWTARKALTHCQKWQENLNENGAYQIIDQMVVSGTRDSVSVESKCEVEKKSFSRRSSFSLLSDVDRSIATSIRSFASYGNLKKAALLITASQMDKEELQDLKAAFLALDQNHDGVIVQDELKALLLHHGFEDGEIDRLFDSLDMDKNGMCSYMEFLAATIEAQGIVEEDRLIETFQRFNVDHSGYISRDNLKTVMGPNYPDKLIDEMMAEADSNNGKISFEAFMNLMRPTIRKQCSLDVRELLQESDMCAPSTYQTPQAFMLRSFVKADDAVSSIRMGKLHGSMAKLSFESAKKEAWMLGNPEVPQASRVDKARTPTVSLRLLSPLMHRLNCSKSQISTWRLSCPTSISSDEVDVAQIIEV